MLPLNADKSAVLSKINSKVLLLDYVCLGVSDTVFPLRDSKCLILLSGPATHLYDGGLAHVLGSGGAVEDPVAVRSPLDVAQPARPVGVAHQVGVESDRVIAGITCR